MHTLLLLPTTCWCLRAIHRQDTEKNTSHGFRFCCKHANTLQDHSVLKQKRSKKQEFGPQKTLQSEMFNPFLKGFFQANIALQELYLENKPLEWSEMSLPRDILSFSGVQPVYPVSLDSAFTWIPVFPKNPTNTQKKGQKYQFAHILLTKTFCHVSPERQKKLGLFFATLDSFRLYPFFSMRKKPANAWLPNLLKRSPSAGTWN